MNDIATLCILYEDFRFEIKHLRDSIRSANPGEDQEALYWVRRSLLTMHEFGKRLDSICNSEEFQGIRGSIREAHREKLVQTRRFINKSSLRDVRNKFGGHLDPEVIGSGLKFHGPDAISKISHVQTTEEMALRLDFAGDLFRGAFASNFASDAKDAAQRLEVFYRQLAELYRHVVEATHILVLEFVWNRFGRN